MEALQLTRDDYLDALVEVQRASLDKPYLDKFKMDFPQGINTVSALEICRLVADTSLDAKVRLAKICLKDKVCEITLPDGSKDSFCMSNEGDSFDAFPVFNKYPLALQAVLDAIYGYVLKKSVQS